MEDSQAAFPLLSQQTSRRGGCPLPQHNPAPIRGAVPPQQKGREWPGPPAAHERGWGLRGWHRSRVMVAWSPLGPLPAERRANLRCRWRSWGRLTQLAPGAASPRGSDEEWPASDSPPLPRGSAVSAFKAVFCALITLYPRASGGSAVKWDKWQCLAFLAPEPGCM